MSDPRRAPVGCCEGRLSGPAPRTALDPVPGCGLHPTRSKLLCRFGSASSADARERLLGWAEGCGQAPAHHAQQRRPARRSSRPGRGGPCRRSGEGRRPEKKELNVDDQRPWSKLAIGCHRFHRSTAGTSRRSRSLPIWTRSANRLGQSRPPSTGWNCAATFGNMRRTSRAWSTLRSRAAVTARRHVETLLTCASSRDGSLARPERSPIRLSGPLEASSGLRSLVGIG